MIINWLLLITISGMIFGFGFKHQGLELRGSGVGLGFRI